MVHLFSSCLSLRIVHVFVLHDFREHASNLLIQESYQLVVHVLIKFVRLAEFVSQGLGRVTLVNDDTLHLVLADVDVHIEFGIRLVNTVADVVQLLVNQVFRVVTIILLWLVIEWWLALLVIHHWKVDRMLLLSW